MITASSFSDVGLMNEAVAEIEAAVTSGHPHAKSVIGFLHDMGFMREKNKAKAFLYHYFAARDGNMQSKMVLASTYSIKKMYDEAVELYSELAEVVDNSLVISKYSPVNIELVRIHHGAEENTEALRKYRGEEDDFQILEYQAQKGNAGAMYKIGLFYHSGWRGLRRDNAKALSWLLKAVEKGEPRSMQLLGEIYARGAGVERNYTQALEWLTLASKQQLFSAYSGIGYLYLKGYGVDKNYTKAKEYFEKAAENEEAGAHYNLGVMFVKGIGLKRDFTRASKHFLVAANAGQPKAFYQLAKMFHTGVGVKKNLPMATALYKIVAEKGPWCSLSRWALEAYLKGDAGKAFLLYSRMAELGYEVAQSNAAWILDKYGEHNICWGESGSCTDAERYQLRYSLWLQASEQGNEHANLLIGDAYYYGRGTESDYERAADAYMQAWSQSNAQAIFNLGYMYEHGQGLPFDLHLAKRYYDEALVIDPSAKLPVTLSHWSSSIRKTYPEGFMVMDKENSMAMIWQLSSMEPDICPSLFLRNKENSMALTLLLNSMEPDIYSTSAFYDSVKELWDALGTRFPQEKNVSRVYELFSNLISCTQNGRSLSAYFGELEGIIVELEFYHPPSNTELFRHRREELYVAKLLSGLDPKYVSVRNSILAANEFPTFQGVRSLLQHVVGVLESSLQGLSRDPSTLATDVVRGCSSFAGCDSKGGCGRGLGNRFCTNFGQTNHVSEKCWTKFGKPAWASQRSTYPVPIVYTRGY